MRRGSALTDVAIAAAALALLALAPLVVTSPAFVDFVIRCAAFGLFATSLNLLVGYAGMTSFGHGMFFGLGAYSFGLIMQRLAVPIPVAFLGTILVTAVAALAIGAICARLTEIYFAFVTLAFQMFLHSLIISWVSLTGGDQGLRGGIPRPPFLGIDLSDRTQLYLASSVLFVGGMLLMRHISESAFGYTLRMIRDNPDRASFLGIEIWRVRVTAFVLAAIFASVGGMIMALFVSGAFPDFAYWTTSGEGIFMIMLGGIGTFLGPVVGTVILLSLNDVVTRLTEHYGLVLGIVILLFAVGLRKGLTDFLADLLERRAASREVPARVEAAAAPQPSGSPR